MQIILLEKIYDTLPNLNFNINLTQPKSIISKRADIGFQTVICAGAIINPQVKIGNGCIINLDVAKESDFYGELSNFEIDLSGFKESNARNN